MSTTSCYPIDRVKRSEDVMTGKERILTALCVREPDRVPL